MRSGGVFRKALRSPCWARLQAWQRDPGASQPFYPFDALAAAAAQNRAASQRTTRSGRTSQPRPRGLFLKRRYGLDIRSGLNGMRRDCTRFFGPEQIGPKSRVVRLRIVRPKCSEALIVLEQNICASGASNPSLWDTGSRWPDRRSSASGGPPTRSLAQPPDWGGPRRPCTRPGGVARVRATT